MLSAKPSHAIWLLAAVVLVRASCGGKSAAQRDDCMGFTSTKPGPLS